MTNAALYTHSTPAERETFYEAIDTENMAPLWESLHELVPPEPHSILQPVKWDYDNVVRARLMKAGGLVTAAEAERRVLVLENPGLKGKASATHTIYAGVQLVLPGEVARAHRHTQSAIRFILESDGGYTAVDGERTYMHPGDFVITPSWTWHDHGNTTNTPTVWVDVLDLPLVGMLGSPFAEMANAESQPVTKAFGDSTARYAQNMFPVDWKPDSRSRLVTA